MKGFRALFDPSSLQILWKSGWNFWISNKYFYDILSVFMQINYS